jgi:hypothetical protein
MVRGDHASVEQTLFAQADTFNSCAAAFVNLSREIYDPALSVYQQTGVNAMLFYEEFLVEAQRTLPDNLFHTSCVG